MKKCLTMALGTLAAGMACAAKTPFFSLDGRESFSPVEVHEEILHLEGLIAADTNKVFGATSSLVTAIARMVNAAGEKGDRAYLPVFEEWSLATNAHEVTRRRSAHAYVQIADVDECVKFFEKLVKDEGVNHWLYAVTIQFFDKYNACLAEGLSQETVDRVLAFWTGQLPTADSADQAGRIDKFLLAHIPEYAASRQRAAIGEKYANTGNDWVTNTFNPIKEHFDAIPPARRVDLRERFPDLPPLPNDGAGCGGLACIIVTLTAVLAVAGGWFVWWRKRRE